ncbi:MAG: hypothetical protein EXQ96_02630 [Alphaproteobacteria bacterium]|nr:hypothetical protein [Alphaproteobacteria bacterium]
MALLLLALAGGCQPLPRPFAPDRLDGVKPLPPAPAALAGVVIEPVSGLTPIADERLRARLRALLAARGVAATLESGTGYRLVGASFGELAPVPAMHWRLHGQDGAVAGEGATPLPADPGAWSDDRLDRVLRPVADRIVSGMTVAKGAAGAPLSVLVERVSGASGDGDLVLARAMVVAIRDAAVPVVTAPGDATYVISGEVRMTPPLGAVQEVEIQWTVLAPDGRRLGVVRQANRVPSGSLQARWGATARAVALAAAEDILGLVRHAAGPPHAPR